VFYTLFDDAREAFSAALKRAGRRPQVDAGASPQRV
jgi:hypothetical protein